MRAALEARRNGGGPGQRNARHVDPEHRDARHEVDGDGIDPAFRALAEAVANDVVGRRVDELRAAGERRYAEAVALVHEVADRLADAEAERRRLHAEARLIARTYADTGGDGES